jgi:hypothetical protein
MNKYLPGLLAASLSLSSFELLADNNFNIGTKSGKVGTEIQDTGPAEKTISESGTGFGIVIGYDIWNIRRRV